MSRGSVRRMELGEYSGTSIRRLRVQNLLLTENKFPANLEISEHAHTYPHFTIILEGSFVESYTDQTFVCQKGSVLVVPQDQSHCDSIGSAGAHSLSIEVSRGLERFLSSESELLNRAQIVSDPGLERPIRDLRRIFRDPSSSLLEIHCAAMQVVLAIFRAGRTQAEPVSDGPKWLVEVKRLIQRDLTQNRSLQELASAVGITDAHLSRSFKSHTGQTVGEFVRECRLRHAAEKLRTSDDSIALIAAEAGFCDQAHFSKVFKGAFGETPSEYRIHIV